MKVPDRCLERLEKAGLLVIRRFPERHVGHPDGVAIGKPRTTPGNSLPGEEVGVRRGDERIAVLDAPPVYLHTDGKSWIVTSHDYMPGPGPGDFVDVWPTADEAVEDILDFYLGCPARMEAKRSPRS